MKSRDDLAPAAAYVLAVALLCVMDAIIKHLSDTFSAIELVWMRYAVAGAALLPLVLALGRWRMSRQALRATAVRSLVMLFTALLFYIALARLPLADAVVVAFTAPFFMVLFGKLFLDEPVPPRALLGIAIGFVGVVVVTAGTLTGRGDLVGYLCSALSAVTYAAFFTMTRRDSAKTDVLTLIASQNIIATLVATPVVLVIGLAETPPLLPVLAMGILGAAGHLMIGWAFANAPSTRIAPIEFTGLVWAALLGAIYFGDRPTLGMLAGAALIVAGCLIVMGLGERKPASRRQP